jgi:hypothetical protein
MWTPCIYLIRTQEETLWKSLWVGKETLNHNERVWEAGKQVEALSTGVHISRSMEDDEKNLWFGRSHASPTYSSGKGHFETQKDSDECKRWVANQLPLKAKKEYYSLSTSKKTHKLSRGVAPLILYFGTRCRWVVTRHFSPRIQWI